MISSDFNLEHSVILRWVWRVDFVSLMTTRGSRAKMPKSLIICPSCSSHLSSFLSPSVSLKQLPSVSKSFRLEKEILSAVVIRATEAPLVPKHRKTFWVYEETHRCYQNTKSRSITIQSSDSAGFKLSTSRVMGHSVEIHTEYGSIGQLSVTD